MKFFVDTADVGEIRELNDIGLLDGVTTNPSLILKSGRNIAEVTTAVAGGDLSTKITVDARGEILDLKNTINTMVDQLNGFASEVTRVAREVGTEGKLGGQAAGGAIACRFGRMPSAGVRGA